MINCFYLLYLVHFKRQKNNSCIYNLLEMLNCQMTAKNLDLYFL